jgi:hypothetical protein
MQATKQEMSRDEIEALRVELKPSERILQIIHFNLLVAPTVVTAYFYFTSRKIGGNDAPVPLLFFLLGVLSVVLSFLVPTLLRNSKPTPDQRTLRDLCSRYQISHMLGCVILESGIIFSALAFTSADVVPNWFVLVPAILILVLLLRFPLPGKMTDWVVSQRESRRD